MASGDVFDTAVLPETDSIYGVSDDGTLHEIEVEAHETAVTLAARQLVRVLLLRLELRHGIRTATGGSSCSCTGGDAQACHAL